MQALFGLISLQTGTELISLALVFNKVTGFYGILAILTGFQLSALQLSTYIYSLAVLVALIFLLPHIRKQSPFEALALAWLYAADTVINAAYTVAFGISWYSANSTAATPEDAGEVDAGARGTTLPRSFSAAEDTAMSIVFISFATLIRVYFTFVVMSFARQVIQRYLHLLVLDANVVDDQNGPFALDLPDGQGRRGKIGRFMISICRRYWLAVSESEEWSGNGHSRKASSSATLAGEV